MGELDGKVAFLTGAGRGVGAGIAVALAKAGATIGLFGRTRETLEQTSAKITELGASSLVCMGDTGVRADVDRAVAEVQARFGPIWAPTTSSTVRCAAASTARSTRCRLVFRP
jgi:NADP-dependent 3-hydroxy acid dehydrogenase YdfG